jgi:hypothetical protein
MCVHVLPVCICICLSVVYVCVYACVYLCVPICACVHVQICVSLCAYLSACMCVYTTSLLAIHVPARPGGLVLGLRVGCTVVFLGFAPMTQLAACCCDMEKRGLQDHCP